MTFRVFKLLLRDEPHSESHQKKHEDESADSAGDVAMSDIESKVAAQWNI